jgi:signal transduction histidine kinase
MGNVNMMNSKSLEFKISSGLKDIIGKDLITDDYVAVFELVKNSYDAKAKNVILTFEDDLLIIADDGKGMTDTEIIEKWLFVAYSEKKTSILLGNSVKKKTTQNSKSNRYFAGAKGIGRFSSDRLGKLLTLTTKTSDSNICHKINVNWSKFEKDQKQEFVKIPVEYSTASFNMQFPHKSKHGTILEITDVFSSWDREKLRGLKHSLEKLINPFSGANDFSIEIICKRESENDKNTKIQRDIINGKIKNTIIDVLKLKTTQIDTEIKNDYIYTMIIDRGEKIYKIKERNTIYPLLDSLKIDLYYLNRKAKYNFTTTMGIEPINYGSIFLFKNGFRVYPFGEKGDDSWGLDNRAQQRHSSYLGTRDLFGKVELITDNSTEFKEVSSRDGGLVETDGAKQLINIFTKAHRRLERYVSGVLWGKDFIRSKYFENDEIAQENRDALLENDKENEDISVIKNSIGSKIDYVLLIKNLVKDKNIKIDYFNKDLLDIVSSRLNELKPRFIKDLEIIAEKTNDTNLKDKIFIAEKEIEKLNEENNKKEKELEKERKRREKAESEAKDAKQAKDAAVKYAKEQEQARKKAEASKVETESELKEKIKQNLFLQSIQSLDEDKIINYHHEIGVQAEIIKKGLNRISSIIIDENYDIDALRNGVEIITLANNKILSISHFATKANFNSSTEKITVDIVSYIEQYTESIKSYFDDLKISFVNEDEIELVKTFKPIEVSVVIDNLLNNSIKARAKKFYIIVKKESNNISIQFIDDGNGIDKSILNNKRVFEKGFTTTSGSGLGLFHVHSIIVDNLKGNIEVIKPDTKGFGIKVVFEK